MSGIEIRDLVRSDEAEVRTLWELVRAAVAERPYHTWLPWAAARTYLVRPLAGREAATLCAWDGERLVGAATVGAPLTDNLHRASAEVWVLPDRRREGIGSALLEASLERVRAWGRSVLGSEVFAPVDADSAGLAFARHHGFRVTLEDGMKVADLQATKDRWPVLAAEAAPHHRDYRLVTTWSPLTAELVDGYCRLNHAFVSLAPTGDADVEAEVWDVERVRDRERRAAEAGRRDLFTFALDGSGEPVGLTELVINETAPHRVLQSGTLVLPDHQGHRLGLAMKAANHQALLERFPEAQWIVTGNADVNAPMNAVNDRLGYRVVERCLEVERPVGPQTLRSRT